MKPLFKTFLAVILAVSFAPLANACMNADDLQVIEGNDAVFKIKSNCSSSYTFRYKAVTVNGTAQSPNDYEAYSDYLTFAKDDRKKKVRLETVQDNTCENFEKFTLKLSTLQVRVWRNGVPRWVTVENSFFRGTNFPRTVNIEAEILQSAWIDRNGDAQCT